MEDYEISSESSEDWKQCKLDGGLFDTENDIKTKKGMDIQKEKEEF